MTKEQVAAWSDQADEHADKTLQCKGEFHPDWHEVRDAYFAKLVRNAAMDQAKQLAWTEIMREGALVTWGDAETLGDRVIEKLESLKEPTP